MMRIIIAIIAAAALSLITACQPITTKSPKPPQNVAALLALVDDPSVKICTLPLSDLRANLGPKALTGALESAFDYDAIATRNDDPSEEILLIFRRAALLRRTKVATDNVDAAQRYYNEFDDGQPQPMTTKDYKAKLEYWAARLAEQEQHEQPDSDDYNLRFCLLNEVRAAAFASTRRYIFTKIDDGTLARDADARALMDFESFYADDFKSDVKTKLFNDPRMADLSPLDIALLRRDSAVLPIDPKTPDAFWTARDAEIDAYLDYISTHDYANLGEKLLDMVMIDQSIRNLYSEDIVNTHFRGTIDTAIFEHSLGQRMGIVDTFNTTQLKAMLDGRGWFRDDLDGAGASDWGWLIAQHADDDPAFQQKVLALIKAGLDNPGVSKADYAYLYDRVQMRTDPDGTIGGREQLYGTQGRCAGAGQWEPWPIEDTQNVDARRADVGLGTLAEYKLRFADICHKDER